jgi:energy-coupling factor transport system ATP-binding protein
VADGTVDAVLRDRADELHAMGVWLPTSALAALRLRGAGFALDPLPLTPDELRTALEATPVPASVASARTGARIHTSSAPENVDARADVSTRPDAPLISVHGLTLRRGRTEVLHDIDLEVHHGEFVAVVGANGAGKTSLIQAIAGVVPPPRGTVHVGGLDVGRADTRTLSSRIGFVFQNPEHQFITNTVFDELAHGLRLQQLPDEVVSERTAARLGRFGLTAKARTHPFLLSGGQKRRLSVGTALVAGAPVLALDEPTFGQDRARADELLGLLRELNQEGTTVLVGTHDMQLVAEYAERMVVMSAGRVLAHAPTGEVFADPDLIERAGLRLPPLARALRGLTTHPDLATIGRLSDLPGGGE